MTTRMVIMAACVPSAKADSERDKPAGRWPKGQLYERRDESCQCLHLDRKHGGKIANDRRPTVSGVGGSVYLSAGGAEVDAAGVEESTAMASRSTLTKQLLCGRPLVSGSHSLPPVRLR